MANYFQYKTKFLAVKWTGSNETEVDEFLATLPNVDSFYEGFNNVGTSVSGTTLTITCDSTNPNYPDGQSLQVPANDWVVAGLAPGLGQGIGFVRGASEPFDPAFYLAEQ